MTLRIASRACSSSWQGRWVWLLQGLGREGDRIKPLARGVPAHPILTQSHSADKSIFAMAQPSCPQGWRDRGRLGKSIWL